MSLKVTRIATSGQPLSGGSTLDATYVGDDVDITTGLPLDGLLDVNAPAPDDQDVLTWDDGAGEWIAAPPAGGDTFTVISPAQLTGNTNNWNPTGLATADEIRVSTDDSRDLTGIVAPAAAKTLLLVNVGDQELQLVHDATSTAANRFICPETSDLTLGEGESVWLVYDMTTARWRVIEVAGGGGAAPTEITDIPTAETDTALVLHPDGAGGVAWGADATGGGGGTSYAGYNTVGGSAATTANRTGYAKKVTFASDTTILSISAYISMVSLAGTMPWVAVYADSAGSPAGPPRAATHFGKADGGTGIVWDTPTTGGWFALPIGEQFAAGDYWIVFGFLYQESNWRIYYDGSGSDKEVLYSDGGYIEGITYRASLSSAGNNYSIRALVLA